MTRRDDPISAAAEGPREAAAGRWPGQRHRWGLGQTCVRVQLYRQIATRPQNKQEAEDTTGSHKGTEVTALGVIEVTA